MTDLSLALLRHGYTALERERRRNGGGDAYVSRLLGRRAVVLRGPEAARTFYDESVARRGGAIPPPLAALLFGRGAVHSLDDEQHRRRRAMFADVLEQEQVAPLVADIGRRLTQRAEGWGPREVDVFEELTQAYGQAVIDWAGCEATAAESAEVSSWLWWIVDGFGFAGRAYPRAWTGRLRANRWARGQVTAARDGSIQPRPGSALAVVAAGDLDPRTAAVELLNVLRPTVAVAWLASFGAVQLTLDPGVRRGLRTPSTGPEHVWFAHEVRRCSPFAPVLAAKARRHTHVSGVDVRPGDTLVLDIWGTLTRADLWGPPEEFRPGRWRDAEPGAYDLIPQGGGPPTGHRCPGEDLAIQIIAETARVLAHVDYEVVSDAAADLTRIPTLPGGGPTLRCSAWSGTGRGIAAS